MTDDEVNSIRQPAAGQQSLNGFFRGEIPMQRRALFAVEQLLVIEHSLPLTLASLACRADSSFCAGISSV